MKSGGWGQRRWAALLSAAVVVATMGTGGHRGAAVAAARGAQSFNPPRGQTLYASGTSSSPPVNFDPLDASSYTGAQGLLYEPLFLFNALRGTFIPWLAKSGAWVTPTTYRLQVRQGVDWVKSPDGTVIGTLTGADVAYAVNLAVSDTADPYHADVSSVRSVTAAGDTVTVTFSAPVGYPQWQQFLWHAPILPRAVWARRSLPEQTDDANTAPVSSGPMLLVYRSATEACYRDNARWWAISQLKLSFKFKYLCDVVSGSSGAQLSGLLAGRIDWSNELLSGIPSLTLGKAHGYGIRTYYAGEPYMIPAGTAWLQMDLAKAPMDNLNFREAVAYAIDPPAIVSGVYAGTVTQANPTGLLPELSSFIDSSVVRKYGFKYSPDLARRFLAKSGYRGQMLDFLVPSGVGDVASAAALICKQLSKIGIHVATRSVVTGELGSDIARGEYDMVINTAGGLGATPWSYFDKVYQLPIGADQAAGANSERFSAPAAWALVQRAAATPPADTRVLAGLYDQLDSDFLQELPEIPVWYTGAWFEASTEHWHNYPASDNRDDQYTPVMWPGWLGSTTTVYALAALEPTVAH